MAEDHPDSASPSEASPGSSRDAVLDFLTVLGRIIRLYKLYPSTHPFVKQGAEDALKAYTRAMNLKPGVTVGRVEGKILIDDEAVGKVSPQVEDFGTLLARCEVESLDLAPGAEAEEILSFARLVALRKDEEAPEELAYRSLSDLPHIRVNTVTYKKVSAQQEIVDRQETEQGSREETLLVEALLQDGSGASVQDALLARTLQADPSALGRAIHQASERAGVQATGGKRLAGQILEKAAAEVMKRGGSLPEIHQALQTILADVPPALVRRLAGGKEGEAAAKEIVRTFPSAFRAGMLASLLRREAPMKDLARAVEELLVEGQNLVELFEGAALHFVREGLDFKEASPYLLDLLALARSRLDREIKAADRPGPVTRSFEPQSRPRVLVADAKPYHEFYASLLDSETFRTEFHDDGLSALDAILRETPSLVILDLKLPGVHGLDIIRRLKRKNVLPPLLIVSGHTSFAQDFEVKTYPHRRFLKKPPNGEAVSAAIREMTAETESEEEEGAAPALPVSLVAYLEKISLDEDLVVPGIRISAHLKFNRGAEAILADAFHLRGGRRGVFVASRSEADADDVRLLRLFQTALRIVGPWKSTGKAAMIQAAGFLGTDRIHQIPIVAQTLVFHPGKKALTLCTAGAPPPLRFLASKRKVRKVGSMGISMGGLMRGGLNKVLEEQRVALEPGDLLVAVSRTVLKAENAKGQTFGAESVGGLLLTGSGTEPSSTAARIVQGVERHTGEKPLPTLAVIAVQKQ